DSVQLPVFHRHWWDAYVRVNRRFAEATAEVSAEGAAVWVQDYQLQLVPSMLRELRPDLKIGFFLHIPFPPVELYMQLPRRAELLRGLLGADLVGFQRPLAAQNFLRLSRHLLGLRPKANEVQVDGRTVRAGAFPISIDVVQMETLAASDAVQSRAKEIRAELGDPKSVILGVDRLDYTKGIEHRLMAFQELLSEARLAVPDTVMVQVATPSRERIGHYQVLRENVERQVGRINGDYGKVGVPAVHYLHQSYSRSELAALYSAADVMMVTPLRDGMNLVAKEYVASRVDQRGTLVLSEFAGAAADLRQAFLVNPHDLDGLKETLLQAINTEPAEATRRMRSMRRYLRTHDVEHWARSFLTSLGAAEAASALDRGPDSKPESTLPLNGPTPGTEPQA
ncbi:MAG: alpha,alpha-trehalose-phosphate synthase (UDP-forming), partial [Micromonosporaceae bacterium]